jgi:hypothetical protein
MHLFRDVSKEGPPAFSQEGAERDIEEAFGTYDAEAHRVSWVEAEPSTAAVETAALEEAHRNKYAYTLADVTKTVPLANSIVAARQAQCVDASLFMGRSFRVGWGQQNTFVVAGKITKESESFSHIQIQPLGTFLHQKESDPSLKSALLTAETERHLTCLRTVFANAETYSAKLPAPADVDMDDGDAAVMGSGMQDGSAPTDTIIEAPNDNLETDSRASQGPCPVVALRPNFHFTDIANAAYKSTTSAIISKDSWQAKICISEMSSKV